jgi:outer membrane protein assembly factor BamB
VAPKILAAVIALAALASACSEDTPMVCGHDVSDLHSSVVALDPATGTTIWSTEIPLAFGTMPPPADGEIRVSLAGRGKDARIAPSDGALLGTVSASHEVTVGSIAVTPRFSASDTLPPDPTPADYGPFVDGVAVSGHVDVGSTRIEQQWDAAGATLYLRATNLDTGALQWEYRPDRRSLSQPALAEGRLVVVTHDPRPFCP